MMTKTLAASALRYPNAMLTRSAVLQAAVSLLNYRN
ncbi:MAG: hypothetical protein ACI9B9_002104, partial [Halioglobus sp.]